MNLSFEKWSLNVRLAAVIGVLGFLAAFAGSPYKGSSATIDAAALGVLVQKEVDHVAPLELADWIIKGRVDFRLIDLRSNESFAGYHIPGAENVPLAALDSYGLSRNEKIVLYSEGGIHAAQAWFLLKARGYQGVYILRGGLEEWKDSVLFPAIAENAGPAEKGAFDKMKEVSKFFGGAPRTGASKANEEIQSALPKLEMPAPVAVPGSAKKKKEGC